jgi:hypothetical protein
VKNSESESRCKVGYDGIFSWVVTKVLNPIALY